MDNLSFTVSRLQSHIEQLEKERDSFNILVNNFAFRLDAMEKSIKLPEEFMNFRDEFKKEIVLLKDYKNEQKQTLKSLKSDQIILEDYYNKTKDSIDLLEEILEQRCEDLNEKIKATSDKEDARYKENLVKFEKIMAAFRETEEKFRKDVMVSPKSILDSNQEIVKKLEISSLDGQNAVMKINNVELSIKVIERRIEQIMSQMKKFEIQLTKE